MRCAKFLVITVFFFLPLWQTDISRLPQHTLLSGGNTPLALETEVTEKKSLTPLEPSQSREKRLTATLNAEPSLRLLADNLVILVLSDPEGSRIDLIRSTWAVGVPNVHFVGSCSACTVQVSGIAEDRLNLFPKVLATFSAALELFPEAELFMKVDFDTYVFYLNLLRALQVYARKNVGALPEYLGSKYSFDLTPTGYCSGGAGYLLSKRSVRALNACIGDRLDAIICTTGMFEDVSVGRCLQAEDPSIIAQNHPGFIGEKLTETLFDALGPRDKPRFLSNHIGERIVPVRPITVHDYKDVWEFLMIDVFTHALDDNELPWKEIVAPPVRLNQSTEK
jgi:hypothetical protein